MGLSEIENIPTPNNTKTGRAFKDNVKNSECIEILESPDG